MKLTTFFSTKSYSYLIEMLIIRLCDESRDSKIEKYWSVFFILCILSKSNESVDINIFEKSSSEKLTYFVRFHFFIIATQGMASTTWWTILQVQTLHLSLDMLFSFFLHREQWWGCKCIVIFVFVNISSSAKLINVFSSFIWNLLNRLFFDIFQKSEVKYTFFQFTKNKISVQNDESSHAQCAINCYRNIKKEKKNKNKNKTNKKDNVYLFNSLQSK